MDLPNILKKHNLYHLLELESFSALPEIKRGYKNFALKYHPDRLLEREKCSYKFDLGTQAYKILIDKNKRMIYDQLLRKKLKRILKSRNRELVLQRRKTYKRFYTQRNLVDHDFNRFVDECRANFLDFLKSVSNGYSNKPGIKPRPKFYSEKTMVGEDFDGFVNECRNDFQEYLSCIPRVKKKRF